MKPGGNGSTSYVMYENSRALFFLLVSLFLVIISITYVFRAMNTGGGLFAERSGERHVIACQRLVANTLSFTVATGASVRTNT